MSETIAPVIDKKRIFWWQRMPLRVVVASLIAALLISGALFAPLIAPVNPYDIGGLSLADSELPPFFMEGGDTRFLLGSDSQGRDVFSTILFGMRLSLAVGLSAVILGMVIGVSIGLLAGYFGGMLDVIAMRFADITLSFPTILIALLINGLARGVLPDMNQMIFAPMILVVSIAINEWTQYARTVRGSTMVEKTRAYVRAAKVVGLPVRTIILRHILPNIAGPILVIATINLALAVLTEATLSFLGVGMPPTQPSLGTLIRIGNEYLFSGIWWVVVFPALTLVLLVLSVNIIGDWLRDQFNPKLRKIKEVGK